MRFSPVAVLLGAAWLLPPMSAVAKEPSPDRTHIEDGILDDIVLKSPSIPPDAVIVMRLFTTEGADLGTGAEGGKDTRVDAAKTVQSDGPKFLADAFRAKLQEVGPFPQVRVDEAGDLPANALVIEGRFTQINPGSKAKRYWGGFGAGKSGLEVQGTVRNAKGDLLAEFTQKRIVVMGVFGGSYLPKMRKDCESIGEDIARFLSAYAKGEDLTH